ncbi:unnamed protein product [Parnassius mnemosyne]|uniref:Integrase catalytic domain-containing protein n=1 Tax=Parnassius mnemosyne TaxID=213953 RepID=A0AAV1L5Z8_9NEOP
MAKSRVAPIKRSITLPRLELMGALIASRLANEISRTLFTDDTCPLYCWTDSAVVLAWIQRQYFWKPFVSNRVSEICAHTKKEHWRHVPGHCNPADLLSRGCNMKTLMDSHWWDGPAWLLSDQELWPQSNHIAVDENAVSIEAKKEVLVNTNVDTEHFSEKLLYFSKYSRIVRVVAWIFRWRRRRMFSIAYISNDEFEEAENILIRLIQGEHYVNRTKLNKKLCIHLDSNSIMRVKTRLGLGNYDKDFSSPILLPGKNVIVRRLVEEKHIYLKHIGSHTLMSELRNRFWITSVRWLCKDIVKKCIICRRQKGIHYDTPETPLPLERIQGTAAFQMTGIDLAGPLYLRNQEKCWVVLFTCATFRAVHFEMVDSLSTNSFIMSLRRFIARRGRIDVIFTDNGTNFRGTANLLKDINWQEVESVTAVHAIKWRFIPPRTPWWEGWWESLIRVLKEMLRRILGRQRLTWVELDTVLCDCEAVINSRPLTYVSTCTDDLRPLTPMLFLHGLPSNDTSDLDYVDNMNLNVRYKYLQKLREDFRVRFRKEYLALLTARWKEKTIEMKKGDIVLVETDAKRLFWPLGLIMEVVTGADGVTRLARVKTQKGETLRPCQRLYPLEISNDSDLLQRAEVTIEDEKLSVSSHSPDLPSSVTGGAKVTKTTRCGRNVKLPARYL